MRGTSPWGSVEVAFEDVEEDIRRIALLNAVQHGGRALARSVIGKLLAERPDLKPRAREIIPIVQRIVDEVNELPLSEQKRVIEERWPWALEGEKEEREGGLPPLPNVEKYGRVVTRFAPNPDCVLHLGSARAIILSHDYARMYKGVFYLRFEDTDPRTKRPRLEFYEAIREDLRWLNCPWDGEFIQSDRLPVYYEWAEKLIMKGHAYVCTCGREKFREFALACKPCPCRGLPTEDHMERWEWMLDGTYSEGEAVVRVKTDLTHPNPAVRDWPALRIIDTEKHPHPRPEIGSKYRVWPLYNFACGVDDHLMGITHIIRGKEHITNEIRQRYIYHHLGWEYPETIHYGRLKITGAVLSKSKIVKGVEEGVYESWDDPRLATLAALRRRGITPEAIRRLMLDVGPKPVDATLSWENLYAYNRKLVDPEASRYFFVENPWRLVVDGVQEPQTAKIPLHPDHPERGYRTLHIHPRGDRAELWISESDGRKAAPGAKFRLIHLFNVEVLDVDEGAIKARLHSREVEEARRLKLPLIHWVPEDEHVEVEVRRPEGRVRGLGEANLAKERVGSIIQLVRYGFGRIDNVEENHVRVYYAHP